MSLRKLAFRLYPVLVTLLLLMLLLVGLKLDQRAVAGVIRKADLSFDKPLVVRLAQGRTTVVSFFERPEKVVPGNPQALEINFIGRDLTVRPLNASPGNLIVYTKNTRYVILLQIATEYSYDDAVSITGISGRSIPLRLATDSFRMETFELTNRYSNERVQVVGQLRQLDHILQVQDVPNPLRCKKCIVKRKEDFTEIACTNKILSLKCESSGSVIELKRLSP